MMFFFYSGYSVYGRGVAWKTNFFLWSPAPARRQMLLTYTNTENHVICMAQGQVDSDSEDDEQA